jgi:hypothetical protein
MAGEKVISGNMRITIDGKTVFHSTSCSLSLNREFNERATKDTNGTERAKSTKSWTASVEGLAVYGSDGTGTKDFFAIFDAYDSDVDAPLDVEFVPDETDADYKLVGEGFIESVEKTMANDEDATISVSILGNGSMTKEALPGS